MGVGRKSKNFRLSEDVIEKLSEYQRLQEKFERAVYKVGELEGRLKEKEELISELRKQIEELKAKPSRRWWEFWK